ncbi:MAG TPA: signal peptidase I [Corynebacterium nuruki]|uniref:Signal peptidase I n=1 Tax=Corynebacterium nuruki TaxID=1032851 RepID=A0A3D4SYA1_9CORY|nr:signal peptidase I [Corynebacterium nuruki]
MDLRLIPVAITAWTGAWWGLAPTVTAALVILPVVGVGAWLLRGRGWQVVVMVGALLLASGVSMLRQEQLAHSPIHRLAEQGAVGQLVVDITSDPRRIPRRGPIPESVLVPATTVHLDARDNRVRQRVPVVLRASGERGVALAHLAVGSRVKVDGRLRAADRADREVALVNVTAPPQQVRAPGWGARQVNRFRAGLRRAASHNPANQAALLPSLVVGDTSGLDADLVGDFKTTGLTHLTAVSGSNLSLTLVFLLASARWAGLRGWWVRGVSIGGVIAFVVICRAEPSVVRATAMGLVALAGLGVAGGRARGLRHACVAVAALVLLALINSFVGRLYQIPSESMEPTLHGCEGCTGDRIFVNKISYDFGRHPEPGDVVVFVGPDSWNDRYVSQRSDNGVKRGVQNGLSYIGIVAPDENTLVKRVIATGGQTVSCQAGDPGIMVDGKEVDSSYIQDPATYPVDAATGSDACGGAYFGPVTVPDGNLWMMGDNRTNSGDSRYHLGDELQGTVPESNVVGKVEAKVWPLGRIGGVGAPDIQK